MRRRTKRASGSAGDIGDSPGDEIAAAVSAWLAELGAHSPLVEDLARAARAGDWAVAHALGEHLSVRVTSLTATATGRTNP
jgi:hypothetical protein